VKASTPAHERILRRVALQGDCWIYTGADNGKGYGVVGVGSMRDGSRRTEYAHRVIYCAFVGPIPDGYVIDHVRARGCRSTKCVNPAHLEAVSNRENVCRGDRPRQLAEENRDQARRQGQRRWR